MQAEGKRPANEIQMAQIDEERARDEVKIEADKNSPLNRWSSRHKLKLVPGTTVGPPPRNKILRSYQLM